MRRTVDPGGPHQVFAAKEQAGALRTAHAFPTAIADEGRAIGEVHVRDRENFRRRVDEDRNASRARHRGDGLEVERALIGLRTGEDVHHRRSRTNRGVQLAHCRDFEHAYADGADRRIVDVAGMFRDDHLVFGKTGEMWNADLKIRISAGDAGCRRVRQRGRAAGGDEPPLGARESGQARADRFGQLVEMHVVGSGRIHGSAHFGQHQRAADNGVGAAGINQRSNAN